METATRMKGREGYEMDGVRYAPVWPHTHTLITLSLSGLKALGVRDLTYRLAFLACAVTSTKTAVGGHTQNHTHLNPYRCTHAHTAQRT